MGLFDNFKRRKNYEDPLERYADQILGSMVWSADAEAWAGEYHGIRFLISYDCRATPTIDLVAYARKVLADPGAFLGTVERAKPAAIGENPALADEIAGLRVEAVHFYSYKTVRRIIADLAGGKRGRSWRVEFREEECEGIGFDH